MIVTTNYPQADLTNSKNLYLRRLMDVIGIYHALPATNIPKRIEAVDTVMMIAADYLTSKRPKDAKAKNKARWDALADIAHQCGQEAQQLGVKQLTSPDDF